MENISVNNVSKTYINNTIALDDVSLSINKGEFYGLIGINGAGKTTLMNSFTGEIKLDSGKISVLDFDSQREGEKIRANVGILPEKESPLSFMTPSEYFSFIGDIRNIDDDVLEERVNKWVKRLNLEDKLNSLNKDLSRGQQQKVLFASIFLHEPEIVFIDEPLANLDPLIQDKIKEYLKEYNEKGNTVVLSTHYLEVATELCETLGVMNSGKLIGEYEVDELSSHDDIKELLTKKVV